MEEVLLLALRQRPELRLAFRVFHRQCVEAGASSDKRIVPWVGPRKGYFAALALRSAARYSGTHGGLALKGVSLARLLSPEVAQLPRDA